MSEEIENYRRCLLRHQTGAGEPWGNVVFRARRGQRGFGFGSFLSSIARIILPTVKKFGKKALKAAVGAALDTGRDILIDRKDPKTVLKTRGRQLATKYLQDITQKGEGRTRRTTRRRKATKRSVEDIFDHGNYQKRARKSR